MKKLYLTIVFCLFVISLFCQDRYYKATITNLQGEKVEGYVSNLFDSKAVKFKKTASSTSIIYTPTQIKGFIFSGNVFESKGVSFFNYKYDSSFLGVTGDAPSILTLDTEAGKTTDTVFVQKIVSGPVDLYKLRYSNNAQHLFTEKDDVMRELPRQYYMSEVGKSAKTDIGAMVLRKQSSLNLVTYEYKTYIDTLTLVCNDSQFLKKLTPFDYSEKKIISAVGTYNKMQGTPNGGLLRQKIPKQFFYGVSVGKVLWKRDEKFLYEPIEYTTAAKGYVLMPLTGLNRHVFGKLGLNYFVYGNSTRSMTIVSASLGVRYVTLSGAVRPYIEASLALSKQFLNNQDYSTILPTILELGAIIPIRNFYLTVGANLSPLQFTPQNGYQLIAWQLGLIF
jgi:hypothetical protein